MKYVVNLNDKKYEVDVSESDAVLLNVSDTAPVASAAAPVQAAPAAAPAAQSTAEGAKVLSPMPGTILEVKVQNGQAVKAGDVMFILEAMKMENDIVAPQDGTVKQIVVSKGASVDTDAVLAVI
ncbi:MAG: biotin/lipoyl-containing protein [Oscillospiraceae bacterium]|nr:biotin/lipoyl-containing protein [Oscillospiraceae bacterium]